MYYISASNVLSDLKHVMYYDYYLSLANNNSNIEILHSFKQHIMEKNITLPNCLLIPTLLTACRITRNFMFAEQIWNYIKTHTVQKPNQMVYSQLLFFYSIQFETGTISKSNAMLCISLLEDWKNAYLNDKSSLFKGVPTQSHVAFLNDFMSVILFKMEGTFEQKQTGISRIWTVLNAFKLRSDQNTAKLMTLANLTIHHPILD